MSKSIIQSVSLGLIIYKTSILSYKVIDKTSNKTFFRLIGGHIEFGEKSKDALKREFKEEIDENIVNVRLLEVFENLFFYKGEKQHEFVSLFKCDFLNDKMYDKKEIIGHEGPDRVFIASWVPVDEFKNNKKILYPPEILKYI